MRSERLHHPCSLMKCVLSFKRLQQACCPLRLCYIYKPVENSQDLPHSVLTSGQFNWSFLPDSHFLFKLCLLIDVKHYYSNWGGKEVPLLLIPPRNKFPQFSVEVLQGTHILKMELEEEAVFHRPTESEVNHGLKAFS